MRVALIEYASRDPAVTVMSYTAAPSPGLGDTENHCGNCDESAPRDQSDGGEHFVHRLLRDDLRLFGAAEDDIAQRGVVLLVIRPFLPRGFEDPDDVREQRLLAVDAPDGRLPAPLGQLRLLGIVTVEDLLDIPDRTLLGAARIGLPDPRRDGRSG